MSKKENNKVNEPLSNYSQPLNFEQVWKMFQATNEEFKEIARQAKETDRKMAETDRRMAETDKRMAETDKRIDKLAKLYSGVSENSKDFAEEFFKRSLESKNSVFGIQYDQVAHLEKHTKKLQGEYDIVLFNGEIMIVIEVKYKLHPNDVDVFVSRKLPNFKRLFPEYKQNKIIGAVAGMSVPRSSNDLAQQHGLLVLTQAGDNISVSNPEYFNPRYF